MFEQSLEFAAALFRMNQTFELLRRLLINLMNEP